jgi:hypothetical protein
MLVHMTPTEVGGLQSLARRHGGSLTVNPETGLPESFFLAPFLPALAGALGSAVLPAAATTALGGLAIPAAVGSATALATGSLAKGLAAGLGAFGGAGAAASAANLAAPALAAAAAPTAAIAAPAAIGGAAGGTGLLASAAPATTLAGATNFASAAAPLAGATNLASAAAPLAEAANVASLAPVASTGTLGSLSAPALPAITPTTTLATGSSLAPNAAEAAKLVGGAEGGTGLSALVKPAFNTFPGAPSQAGLFATPESMANVISPTAPYGQRVMEGFGKVFESPSSFMDFVGDNKMNLVKAASPLFTPEEPEEQERRKAMIRPYEYQVDNFSGAPIDPFGKETERYRGRFIEKDPYEAAKGGLMSLAEGGQTSTTTSSLSGPISATPAEARVYSQIAAVQRAAGIPSLDLGNIYITEEAASGPYKARPIPSTAEQDYGIYRPEEEDSPSYHEAKKRKEEEGDDYKRGGDVKSVRKPISRSDPFYEFGLDMSKIAEEQFAGGGMAGGYSYDPISNSYRMMAKGGLTSLKAGGLREGAFIVPADVISHLGNGSSEAGMKIVQERLKGRPIKGPGDGMSDSIPTTIAGRKPARVANEEAEIPPEIVAALGGGSLEKGAKKLYEMMDKIRQDRTGKKKQAPEVKAEKYMPA